VLPPALKPVHSSETDAANSTRCIERYLAAQTTAIDGSPWRHIPLTTVPDGEEQEPSGALIGGQHGNAWLCLTADETILVALSDTAPLCSNLWHLGAPVGNAADSSWVPSVDPDADTVPILESSSATDRTGPTALSLCEPPQWVALNAAIVAESASSSLYAPLRAQEQPPNMATTPSKKRPRNDSLARNPTTQGRDFICDWCQRTFVRKHDLKVGRRCSLCRCRNRTDISFSFSATLVYIRMSNLTAVPCAFFAS
jgi:hypothetical protein